MNTGRVQLFVFAFAVMALSPLATAHFQVLVPSTDSVSKESGPELTLDLLFTHPMEQGPAMDMGAPRQFGVLVGGQKTDLSEDLTPVDAGGHKAYAAKYKVKRPGAHVFFVEPEPYFEAAEETFIQHFTKVIVDAYGSWSGWDDLVGFPVEIKPLTRPYGLWAGNVFQGQVLKNGEPVPNAHLEVEYFNKDGDRKAATEAHITQVIKADANGVFTFGIPWAGWWGFAALIDGDETMTTPDGKEAGLEMGASMWICAYPVPAGK